MQIYLEKTKSLRTPYTNYPINKGFLGGPGIAVVSSLPFLLTITLVQLYNRAGIIILTYFHGKDAAGIFSIPDRFLTTGMAVLVLFAGAIFPSMSRLFIDSKDQLFDLYQRCIRIILVSVLPVAALIFIFSEEAIMLTVGDSFRESIPVLRIMCWTIVFTGLNTILSSFLLATHHQKEQVKLLLLVYVMYLGSTLILIPAHGYMGLAYANLGAEGFLFVLYFTYVSRKIHAVSFTRMILAPGLASVLMITASQLLTSLSVWLMAPLLTAISIVSLSALKGVQISDLGYL